MSPKAKKPPLVLSKFANKQKVPKTPPVIRSLFGAAMPKAKATTPMKRKTGKSEGSPAGPSDSPPAKQRSPASDAGDHQGASSSGAAASSSSGHFVAPGNDLVLAVYEVDDSTKCTMCEKTIGNKDCVVVSRSGDKVFKKCGDCNRLQGRVQRTLQKRGDLKDRWGVMSREQRKQFFLEHHAAMGQDLVLQITQTTQNMYSSSQKIGFATRGDWMDVADLEKVYKDKPDQFDAIMANSKKMLCPFRGVELVEHITYNSRTDDQQQSMIQRNITMSQESSLKAAKKMKAITSGPKAEPGGPPKLSAAAVAKLGILKETMATLRDTIETKKDSCTDEVPKKFMDHMQLKTAEMMAHSAEIDVVIDAGRGKVSELMAVAKLVMRAAKEALATVTSLTVTLDAMH
jgi:hypothetical protein